MWKDMGFAHNPRKINDSLDRRIEHIDFGWFDFPLTRRNLFHQIGPGCLESFLRFPDGEAYERSFFGILKNVRDENDSWLLFHQFVKLAHLLNPELFLFRLRIMNGVE